MTDIVSLKEDLLAFVESLNQKFELSKTVSEDYYEPGMMENLEQYKGEYDREANIIILRTEAKGLRYDNRTRNLEKMSVGDSVDIERDSGNLYNPNNFTIKDKVYSLGNLPAELCNALAPLYDTGYATVLSSAISYIEKLKDRSRYAKQGVMFVELTIKLRGI